MSTPQNWTTVAPSQYPWEQDALAFVRQHLPPHDSYRAWSNFEFIADDGSINEVDLFVCTPQGFFLVEIKSRPGRLRGDAGTWTWETDGRLFTIDNPLLAANAKAKKLRTLLQHQKAGQKKGRVPFIEALVFCSAPELRCDLQGTGRYYVCLRDRDRDDERPAQAGIMAALKRRDCPGLPVSPRGTYDRPVLKMLSQAMEQAGIRASQRQRHVGDYILEQLLGEGPGYQDWQARHRKLTEVQRRVRIYTMRLGATAEERRTIERAAQREAQLLETLQHPGILRREGFTDHALGSALIFEHDPLAIRLDHFLAQRQDRLSLDVRFDFLRQIAEAVRFAHAKRIIHRALSPTSILVSAAESKRPQLKIFNWQVSYRQDSTELSRQVSATSHADRLVEDASTAYMAPEALADMEQSGEHLDVFSLGALAYHLFAGVPPAANALELSNKLRATRGLQLSAVLNGVNEELQWLIQYSTHPEVSSRIDSVADFLSYLEDVEEQLTAPEHDFGDDPCLAQKGMHLPGNLTVLKRLGQGACSVALLVQRDAQEYVLKIANAPQHNQRLQDESAVLKQLRHPHIVEYCETLAIGDRTAILMRQAGQETLGQRLRKDGRLHVDLLQRFGEDLLGVVGYLEDHGIAHRDLKPDNIGVGLLGRSERLHLVLFDFSLSRTPADNIRAGTTGYLDPLLPVRKPPRWDLYAERYAAAVTLYELAAGPHNLPTWGDGSSDPSQLSCEVSIEAELFEAELRDSLSAFFRKALRRNPAERFDNAEEMLQHWQQCFAGIARPGALADHGDTETLRQQLATATPDTALAELGLGTRALNALDRANILTVADLFKVPLRRLSRLRGVGNQTRREITDVVKMLRQRLGYPTDLLPPLEDAETPPHEAASLSVDALAQRLFPTAVRHGDASQHVLQTLLGLSSDLDDPWPSQAEVARCLAVSRARIGQVVRKFQERASREPAMTRLRTEVHDILQAASGVMVREELLDAILAARGCVQDEPTRSKLGGAVLRAAVEAERSIAEPRFLVRRDGPCLLVASTQELADYAFRLGAKADHLAGEDPLAPPTRVLQTLRAVPGPAEATELSDTRLLRLATGTARQAAMSSRQEFYPRGMEPLRALKLSQGALMGVPCLRVEQLCERVSSRYPEAAALPQRPALDELLRLAGVELHWDDTAAGGQGGYVSRFPEATRVTSASASLSRRSTISHVTTSWEITPEVAEARQFEERLQRASKDGAFLVLLTPPRSYQRTRQELCRRFSLTMVDVEALFLQALKQVAEQARVTWELVLQTDATPYQGDWHKLMVLVNRAIPLVEAQLLAIPQTILAIYPGLLARYDRLDVLERLRDKAGRRDGIPGLWLLLPGQPLIDGKAVPLLSPGQRVVIPESWLRNVHRGGETADASC